MKNEVSKGNTFNYIVAGSAVVSGQLIVKGKLVGFAVTAGAVGDTIAVQCTGVYSYTKTTSQAWTQGVAIYLSVTTGKLTTNNGQEEMSPVNNTFVGFAFDAADAADATGKVLLVHTDSPGSAQAEVVTALGATTNIDAVPGSFADVAAVRTYLAGANVIPNIEARLDGAESKINAILSALKEAGIMASA